MTSKRPWIDHSRDALEAPATPQENRLRIAREANAGPLKGSRTGLDPTRVKRKGNRAFVRKDEERGKRRAS